MTPEEALERLAQDEGYDHPMAMLEARHTDSVVPGICLICGYSTDVEPDQNRGYCEECCKNTVKSCLILAGII
jgi:hypothetical protein